MPIIIHYTAGNYVGSTVINDCRPPLLGCNLSQSVRECCMSIILDSVNLKVHSHGWHRDTFEMNNKRDIIIAYTH